ncbi:ABC transporter ATP-binding protein [Corynebacterium ciconiae]|uniref:ABC transporter ATP-binding protein n=1 Tax=Corynebacterium ciconiae TaxID=227319 RepID=UPI0005900BE5|nr:ABC transporter ATP-binding protein [Corynebacterium ciconiae]
MTTQHSPTSEPIVQVCGLRRSYRTSSRSPLSRGEEFVAVKDVSFDIHSGEVFGLLGTNGAGKTTTLSVLEGLNSPTAGTVRVFGLDPRTDRAKVRPRVGIMLQSGGLPHELTVAETLRMWRGTCSTPRPTAAVLGDVDLQHRADTRVRSLSGGEQRRLDLACALIGDPQLLFLDEPTTGLDPESRQRTWQLLQRLNANGMAMVLTTHYLEEAEALCDRIAIMHRGEIHLHGSLSDLVATVPSTIRFTCAPEHTPVLIDGIRGTSTTHGSEVRIETTHLEEDAYTVLSHAHQQHLGVQDFTAQPASLHQVFMQIAGDTSPLQQTTTKENPR